ncbi:MAG: tetratricopeptide repeat protein [Verrucomicrobia bacterium]|nr:tetratricopeptide repeat protein [Verrucomicrobiota bacterium]
MRQPAGNPDIYRRIFPLLIAVVLFAGTITLFWPAHSYDFVNLDDNIYVKMNPCVQQGLTVESLKWAWTSVYESYWIPLSWTSYLIDTEIFGGGPAGYHVTNILLHGVNALLLFFLLRRMTGRLWESCCVAVLFAVHPLRVESVVWITERKDVLSAFFFFLSLTTYIRFTEKRQAKAYILTVLFLLCSLMSKPMMVTFPFVLLLLDLWPLGRLSFAAGFPWGRLRTLCIEKLPFFALVLVFSWVTYWAQAKVGSVHSLEAASWIFRLKLVPYTYGVYIWKTLFPTELAAVYSASQHLPHNAVFCAVIGLFVLASLSFLTLKRQPWVAVGFLWFTGILFPLSGIVRVGTVYMANRFTYVASIGMYILIVWSVSTLTRAMRLRARLLAPVFIITVIALAVVSRWNMSFWKDTETLFRRDMVLNPYNFVALNGLGSELGLRNRHEESLPYFYQALRLSPDYDMAHRNLAVSLVKLGREGEALPHFAAALKVRPKDSTLMGDYASALCKTGDYELGLGLFEQALALNPDGQELLYNAALANKKSGNTPAAIRLFGRLTNINPDHHEAHYHLATLYREQQQVSNAYAEIDTALKLKPTVLQYVNLRLLWMYQDETPGEVIAYLKSALARNPDSYDLHNNLAWMLATQKDPALRSPGEALAHARQAAELAGEDYAALLDTLAACHAANGHYTEAVDTAEKAVRLAEEEKRTNLVEKLLRRLDVYESGCAWIDE